MEVHRRHIVGISGGSCAGKTWLADRLLGAFGDDAVKLSQDDFYFDRSHLSPAQRARLNFDHPRAIDWERLEQVLTGFAEGRAASVPRYDFATHGRLGGESALQPAAILLVEGLWLFRRPQLRKMFDVKIFIRSSAKLCTERRVRRDTTERGRTRDQVIEQLNRYTLPMAERFVAPQEKWADVVLDAPISEEQISEVANKIQATRKDLVVGI
ncbi:MAG TPA: uridine kinase [Verrucomicrobiae bacterium]